MVYLVHCFFCLFIFTFQNFGYNAQIYLGLSCLSAHLLSFAVFSSKFGTFSAVVSSSTTLLSFFFWVSQWQQMLALWGTAHFFSVCFLSLVHIRSVLLSYPQTYLVFLLFIPFCCGAHPLSFFFFFFNFDYCIFQFWNFSLILLSSSVSVLRLF